MGDLRAQLEAVFEPGTETEDRECLALMAEWPLEFFAPPRLPFRGLTVVVSGKVIGKALDLVTHFAERNYSRNRNTVRKAREKLAWSVLLRECLSSIMALIRDLRESGSTCESSVKFKIEFKADGDADLSLSHTLESTQEYAAAVRGGRAAWRTVANGLRTNTVSKDRVVISLYDVDQGHAVSIAADEFVRWKQGSGWLEV